MKERERAGLSADNRKAKQNAVYFFETINLYYVFRTIFRASQS